MKQTGTSLMQQISMKKTGTSLMQQIPMKKTGTSLMQQALRPIQISGWRGANDMHCESISAACVNIDQRGQISPQSPRND